MSRNHLLAALAVSVLALPVAAQNLARQAGPNPGVPVVAAGDSVLGSGTIVYDNDTPVSRNGTDGGTVGNRFTPAAGTHSIATVSFAAAGNFSTSMVMTVWDVNAPNVNVLQRQLLSGIPQSPATTGRFSAALTAAVVGHSGSFIAGLRNTDYDPCAGNTALVSTCDGVAMTQGSSPAPPVAGKGARVNFTSASFVPVISTVASTGQDLSVNAIFRVTGDNLPVELMEFTAE